MCCASSDGGISPSSLDSSRALHDACSSSYFFNIPLLKFKLLELHFMYFRSEAPCVCKLPLPSHQLKKITLSEGNLQAFGAC